MRAPFPLFAGASVVPEQTALMRRAHALIRGDAEMRGRRLALFETDAPLEDVARYYAAAIGDPSGVHASVSWSTGDFAADEASLAPILAKLDQPFTHGATGHYRSAEIAGAPGEPRVSLQRPYRDFARDRIVDRTLIVLSD
ncbi:MAG: hypothetical protein HYU52_15645 [Acidobacteria bacterium]|nr:hypothetical protein [Acidobacteriota bacterium]